MTTTTKKTAPAWIAACSKIQKIKGCNRSAAKEIYDMLLKTGQNVDQWCAGIEATGNQIMNGDRNAISSPMSQVEIARSCEAFLRSCGGNIELAKLALANHESIEALRLATQPLAAT